MVNMRRLFVFDFDWTVIEQDTDRYVFEVHSPELRQIAEDTPLSEQTIDLFAGLLVELHKKGITKENILKTQRGIPFHPSMIRALKALKQLPDNPAVIIVSNSNTVYLDAILHQNDLLDVFDEVITNPAHFDKSGCLIVEGRVSKDGTQHGCPRCDVNLCKAQEVKAYIARNGGQSAFSRVIYSGDGSNDYCPIDNLRDCDHALVRKGRALEKLVDSNPVKCGITKWFGSWELERSLVEQSRRE